MAKRANGEGFIHQRKDGRWAASISIGGMKRKYFLGHTRGEVAAKLTEALNDQNKGIPAISNNVSVPTYLKAWLANTKTAPALTKPTISTSVACCPTSAKAG